MKTWTADPVPTVPTAGRGGPLLVHDTATNRAVTPQPVDGRARMYVCGITPYDATHIGHAATYVTFDLINRVWRDAGLEVLYVQNVTDVDEPLLERAERDGVHWEDLAAREIDLFRQDMEALRVLPPDHYVGAVEGIPDDVAAVGKLLADTVAYRVPVPDGEETVPGAERSDVYLDLSTQPTFGSVSGWTREQMMEVFADRGGDPEREGKRDPFDPLLWRAGRVGEPHWDGGPLGQGRPGWHIECSTIAQRYLGPGFDVQGGGDDLVFPHHEMSAVEGTALQDGARFAQAYVHQAMVGLEGEKMSKSKGNLVLVSRLRGQGIDPMALRLVLLDHHYRRPWEWTDEMLHRAQDRLARWHRAAALTRDDADGSGGRAGDDDAKVVHEIRRHLAADLDSPAALRSVDRWAGSVLERGAGSRIVPAAVDALLGVLLQEGAA